MLLYNNRTRKKQSFIPLKQDKVGMYVCGPTVYDLAHLGNARPVVIFDILYRLLKYMYSNVTYVRNITDVDDKINAAAQASGQSIREITLKTTKAFHEDISALNTLSPDYEPRATDHIAEMIIMIKTLIDKGHAYHKSGHVLFRVPSFINYGALSKKNKDELLEGARIEVAPYKKNAGDFVLWKPSDEKTPGWDSPWGVGRPGWHIECSAMSKTYLGEEFDIHGGGIDLIFPHHENELAQSCCANGTKILSNFWMHNGHLMVNGQKMSKSLGNFLTIRDLLAEYDGEVIRFALMQTHYRKPLDWSMDETLAQAKQGLDRIYNSLCDIDGIIPSNGNDVLDEDFLRCLKDDLNTSAAIHYLYQLVNDLYKTKDKKSLGKKIINCGNFLGILHVNPETWFKQSAKLALEALSEKEIAKLIAARNEARKSKDFIRSDLIRQQLLEHKIILQDSPTGTTWRRL